MPVDRIIQRWDGTHWRTTLQGLTAYTPVYTGLTVGAGTSTGGYSRCEYTVTAQGEVTLGAGGAVSDFVYATLPVPARWVDTSGVYTGQPGIRQTGIAYYLDVSASRIYHGCVDANMTIPGQIIFYSSTGTNVHVGPTNPFRWASGRRTVVEDHSTTPPTTCDTPHGGYGSGMRTDKDTRSRPAPHQTPQDALRGPHRQRPSLERRRAPSGPLGVREPPLRRRRAPPPRQSGLGPPPLPRHGRRNPPTRPSNPRPPR